MRLDNKSIRDKKRALRKALTVQQKQDYSKSICKTLVESPWYQKSQHIGVYHSLPEEVSLGPFITQAWRDDKQLYLPVVIAHNHALSFAEYNHDSSMTKDMMNIPIPQCSHFLFAEQLDMIIVPLVAFDDNANRVGMGGGFYDRTLAFRRNQSSKASRFIGVAFDVQRTNKLSVEKWDIQLDNVITETRLVQSQSL